MCDGGDNGGNNGDLSSECVMEAIMEEIMEIYRVWWRNIILPRCLYNVHARKAALNGKKWRIIHGEFCYFFWNFRHSSELPSPDAT